MDLITDNTPEDISHRTYSTETRSMSNDNGNTTKKTTDTTCKDNVASQDKNKDETRAVDMDMDVDVDTHAAIVAPTDKNDHRRKLDSIHRSSSDPGVRRKRAAKFAIEIPRFVAKHPRTIRENKSEQGRVLVPCDNPETEEWLDKAIRYDPTLGRLRYSHPEPDLVLNEKHQRILEAAFQVHEENLDFLTDEDIEFFAAVTGITYQATKTWFTRRKEDMEVDEASSQSSSTPAPPRLSTKTQSINAAFGPSTGINRIVGTLVEPSATNIELHGKATDRTAAADEPDTPKDSGITATKPSISETRPNYVIADPIKPVEPTDTTITPTNVTETATITGLTTAVEPSDIASKGTAKQAESSSVVTKAAKVVELSNKFDNPPATVEEHSVTSTKAATKDGISSTAEKSTVTLKSSHGVHAIKSNVVDTEHAARSTKSNVSPFSNIDPTGTDERASVLFRTVSIKTEVNPKRPVITQTYGKKSTRKNSASPTLAATPRSTTTMSSLSPPSASTSTERAANKKLASTDKSPPSHIITRKRVPYKHQVIQERRCIEKHRGKESGIILYQEPCKPCMEQQDDSICSFKNFRIFYADSRDDGHDIANYRYGPDFSSDPGHDRDLRFRRSGLDREMAQHIFAHTFPFGHVILERELLHVLGRTGLKLRAIDLVPGAPDHEDYVRCSLGDRQYCEKCKGAIIAGYWMCCVCGEELCLDCFDAFCDTTMCTKDRQHLRKQFVACGKFHAHTLQDYLTALRNFEQELPQAAIKAASKAALLPATVATPKDLSTRVFLRSPVRYDVSKLVLENFRHSWQQGKVLQVEGVGKRLKLSWTPEYLVSEHGNAPVSAICCQNGDIIPIDMARYFSKYFNNHKSQSVWKMGDWPEEPFQEVLPELFEDLMHALPLPEYTSPKGVFNLAKYTPIGQVNAEISAKLYVSKRQLEKHKEFGPMQLSAEMSDSIYICTYTQAVTGGTALWWDIYRSEDRPLVEAFLRKVMAEKNSDETDPFTYDSQYLSPKLKNRLYHATGVRATEVHQKLGEAVMIPAGCVRQARYLQGSIVVGLDFVSPERFAQTMDWSRTMRRFNLERKGEGLDDVLQANNLAFFGTIAMLDL